MSWIVGIVTVTSFLFLRIITAPQPLPSHRISQTEIATMQFLITMKQLGISSIILHNLLRSPFFADIVERLYSIIDSTEVHVKGWTPQSDPFFIASVTTRTISYFSATIHFYFLLINGGVVSKLKRKPNLLVLCVYYPLWYLTLASFVVDMFYLICVLEALVLKEVASTCKVVYDNLQNQPHYIRGYILNKRKLRLNSVNASDDTRTFPANFSLPEVSTTTLINEEIQVYESAIKSLIDFQVKVASYFSYPICIFTLINIYTIISVLFYSLCSDYIALDMKPTYGLSHLLASISIILTLFHSPDKIYEQGTVIFQGPLSGVRILDFSRILAGPFATMILGDLGAEIIKIERPNLGDDTRSFGPPYKGSESCYFLCINRNKKSVAIDFKQQKGVEILKKFAKNCDVLVENFMPGVMDRVGLGYDALKATSPHLIYCSLTGYGSSGPYINRAGYDLTAASIGGLTEVTGPKGGEPCKAGVAMTDIATGLYLHGAIMAALLYRLQHNNIGQKIECNLLSTQVSCMVNLASNYLNAGRLGSRLGTEHESIVPYQVFPTADGYISAGAGNDHQFKVLCQKIQLEDLPASKLYRTNSLRVKNREQLICILNGHFKKKTTKQWLEILEGSSLPYAPINKMNEVFSDPQVIHNQMVKEYDHPTAGRVKMVEPSVKYSEGGNMVRSVAPTLGQHTRNILEQLLGLSREQIKDLEMEGVIQSS